MVPAKQSPGHAIRRSHQSHIVEDTFVDLQPEPERRDIKYRSRSQTFDDWPEEIFKHGSRNESRTKAKTDTTTYGLELSMSFLEDGAGQIFSTQVTRKVARDVNQEGRQKQEGTRVKNSQSQFPETRLKRSSPRWYGRIWERRRE